MADKVKLPPPMTYSKTPDWVKYEAEKLAKESVREAFRDPLMPMYIPMVPMLSQALLSAYERGRKEGIEEAAKVAKKGLKADGLDAWARGYRCASSDIEASIRLLLEVKG